MELIKQSFFLLLLTGIVISCKKSALQETPLASINVMNAVVNGKNLKLGSNVRDSAVNMNFNQFGIAAGNQLLYLWPTGDSIHPYFNRTLSINNGDIYSLFLAGNASTQIDTLLLKEAIPAIGDSSANIRFINLSPNSKPLNITLSAMPTVNEVTGLTYKSYTDFKSYPGLYNSAYTFQIRDAGTNTILTSVAFTAATVPRFANVTLVIRGLQGGSPALGVTIVKNDR